MPISLHELYDIRKEKERKQKKTYEFIMDQCSKKIKRIAEHGGYNIYFFIPSMVLGLPLLNVEGCSKFITDYLRKAGFLVQQLPEPNKNVLYISWHPNDVNPKKLIKNSF